MVHSVVCGGSLLRRHDTELHSARRALAGIILPMGTSKPAAVLFTLWLAAACSPVFDWRELQPESSGIAFLSPCKPDRHARPVLLGGSRLTMEMLVCQAGGVTFAVSFVDVPDLAAVGAVMAELRALAVSNVSGTLGGSRMLQVTGMTPNENAVRLTIAGRLPDGAAVEEQALIFTKGLRVYQASMVGRAIPAEAAEAFVSSLRLAS
jgi:hypothetical protein